jgi:hypothetical protein
MIPLTDNTGNLGFSTTRDPAHDYTPAYAPPTTGGSGWFDNITGGISKLADTALDVWEVVDRTRGKSGKSNGNKDLENIVFPMPTDGYNPERFSGPSADETIRQTMAENGQAPVRQNGFQMNQNTLSILGGLGLLAVIMANRK